MSKPVPLIFKYMTTSPITVGEDTTLADAAKTMASHGIRHLPVMDGERVTGVLSMRDIELVRTLDGVDPTAITVDGAMARNPYTPDASTPVTEVAATMAEHKYGSAIVVSNGKVVGVFTTVDACRVLAEVFDTRLH